VVRDSDAIVPALLYWPLLVTDKIGLTSCGDADLIRDKMSCAFTGLIV